MSKPLGLSYRHRKILFAVVAEYIATGAPVGSRTLARKYVSDLSPATIRNVLSDLEEAGFLLQPHTSAGRVPTERALRAFIDALTEFQEIPEGMQDEMRRRFEEVFDEEQQLQAERLRRAGAIVSELTGSAAIVMVAPLDSRQLSQLRFIVTRPKQLLAVLVFNDGTVENRFIDVDELIAESDLERIHNLLNDVVEGRTLASLRDLFIRRADDERVQVDELRRRAFELGRRALKPADSPRTEVVIEGTPRLLDLPEYGDVERLRQLMRALEDRQQLVVLLDRIMQAGAVSVYLGNESGEAEQLGAANLALVVAPYGDGEGGGAGTVGVIGPTRMDYAKMVPLVDATAAAITAAMKKGR